jgi:hypothetical protein
MTALLTVVLLALVPAGPDAGAASLQAQRSADTATLRELRDRIEDRYEIIPLSGGVALRPKRRVPGLQVIEISNGAIAIDGAPASGRELRSRLGADADPIRAFLGSGESSPAEPPEPQPSPAPEPPPAAEPELQPRLRHRIGERVRIFGNVVVDRDQSVDGQVVTVFGSSRIDGEVDEQVVAVLGSVELGPEARIDGDVTVVGGSLRRAPGAVVTGSVREIGLGGGDVHIDLWGAPWWGMMNAFHPFSGTGRLVGTAFRALLLMLLGSIALLIARGPVERVGERVVAEPLKAGVVGVLAELLFFPALVLTSVILAITIIGIPLLLFMPFLFIGLLFVFLAGFTGTAYAVGSLAFRRVGPGGEQPYLRVCLGVAMILGPLLLARLLGVAGGPMYFFAGLLAAVAFLVEYVAWTIGFGAALLQAFGRWQARRAANVTPEPETDPRLTTPS